MRKNKLQNIKIKSTWLNNFGSFKMWLNENDHDFSSQVKHFGEYSMEKLETNVFRNYLKPGMSVLDLGANIGFYSLLASSIIKPNGKVIAFEPFPGNIKIIKSNIAENSFKNMIVVEAAVSDHVGRSFLYVSPYYFSEHSLFDYHYSSGLNKDNTKIEVNVLTVDDYLENHSNDFKVDFIKMDIEGSEKKALKGMRKVFDENEQLVMLTEFWPQGFKNDNEDPVDFLVDLKKLGFDIYHVDEVEEKVYPVSVNEFYDIMIKRINNSIENNIIQSGGWYTNLLCIK
jgi:FkbM family methyltransferase